jgi:hypothetical protein
LKENKVNLFYLVAKELASWVSHEIKDNKLKVKVYYKTNMKVIEVEVKSKLRELIELAKKELNLEDEKFSNLRLRLYKPLEDAMLDTFTGMDDREILYLGITPSRCYYLERKEDGEEFGEYDPLLIKIRCSLYDEKTISSDSDSNHLFFISISRRRPIKDFEDSIRKVLEIPKDEYFLIFKRRVISDSLKEAHLLNSEENLLYSLEEMKVYEATRVLVERFPKDQAVNFRPDTLENFNENQSKWVSIIERENYTLLIRFNLPSLTPQSEMATFDQELMVDSRLTVRDLKKQIAEYLEIEEHRFILRRGGKVGIELRDLEKTMTKCGLLSGSIIYTAFGTPTGPNEILLKMLMTIKADNEINHHYNLKPIAEIAVDQNSTADDVIAKALDVYMRDDGEDLHALNFRLREKHSRSLMKVYRNIAIKRQGIYDGKQLVLENIDPQIQIPQIDMRQYLLVVQILDPETISFEEIFEFAIEKTDTLALIAQKIYEKCPKIPPEYMSAAKVATVWGLDNLYGINLPYVSLNDSKQTLTGQPFFIAADGNVLL